MATRTSAILLVTPATYAEIRASLVKAGYQDQFGQNRGVEIIKMEGIAIKQAEPSEIPQPTIQPIVETGEQGSSTEPFPLP